MGEKEPEYLGLWIMKWRGKIAVLIWAALLLSGSIWCYMMRDFNITGGRTTTMLAEKDSPSGEFKATVWHVDFGATTIGLTSVMLVGKGWTGDIWNMTNRVFMIDRMGGVEIEWVSTNKLLISSKRTDFELLKSNYLGNEIEAVFVGPK